MEEQDWWPEGAETDENDKDNSQSFTGKVIPDLFRRAVMTGIGSVLMTEEGIRSALAEMKMPREAVNYVVSQAERTKRDLIVTLARELRTFLDGLELQELISKSLQGKQFEIRTTIRVVEDGDGEKVGLQVKETESKISFDEEPAEEELSSEASKTKGKKKAKKKKARKTKDGSAHDALSNEDA